MRLEAYLAGNKITFRQFATALGVDVAQVHRWATGKRTPSLVNAAKIEAATEGKVRKEDLLPIQPVEHRAASEAAA